MGSSEKTHSFGHLLKEDDILYHLHIPKIGGTSLRNYFLHYFDTD